MVTEGDILYALYGATSGEVGISKLKGAINQAILAIQPHNGYDSQFIMQWLRKSKESIISTYLQGGQGNLSGNIVKELLIDLPACDEQKQIGGYFEKIDALITLHQWKYILLSFGKENDWEQRKLGELAERVQKNDGRMDLPTLTISAGNGWLNQEERFSGNIAGNEQKNYTLLKKGELAYNHGNSKLAKYGAVFELRTYEEALVPRVYHSFRMVDGNSPTFIEYLFATKLPDRELGKLISSGARMDGLLNIGFDEFFGISLTIPSTEEQSKIGEYFTELDNLITLHQRKCKQTETLKKYMLQKMFPKDGATTPEIRFEGFTGDWEQRKLEDIAERVTRKNQDLVSELPLTISAQYGLIDQNEFFDKRVASKDVSGYYLIYNGEFAYNKSTSNDAPWGAIKRLDRYENGVLSTLYIVFRIKDEDKTSSDFIATYYDTSNWHREIQAIAAEGARNHGLLNIAPADFFKTELMMPQNIEEQQKIGDYFKALDSLITLHQRKCTELQNIKKYMLQNMFI